jgi:F-type H+-transporting ATPase subunit b
MLQINPGLIVWTIATFVLLLIVLKKIAWKPLMGALESREKNIRETLEEAEEAKREAARILNENKLAMERANDEASRILRDGRTLAEQMKNELLAKAQENAKSIVDQAKAEIQREKETALLQVRNEVADLAITVAEKILDQELDTKKQKKIVDTELQKLPTN